MITKMKNIECSIAEFSKNTKKLVFIYVKFSVHKTLFQDKLYFALKKVCDIYAENTTMNKK